MKRLKRNTLLQITMLMLALIILFVKPVPVFAEEDEMSALLPQELKAKGFSMSGNCSIYDDTNLYSYIDGGAPFYIEKGFEKLITCEYTKDKEAYTTDIYRMKNVKSAAVLMNAIKKQGQKKPSFGEDGQEGKNQTEFIREKYFVRITAFKSDTKALDAIKELGKALDSRIQEKEKGKK